jgi:hypothetical protein
VKITVGMERWAPLVLLVAVVVLWPLYLGGLVWYELFSWVEKRTTGWAHRGTQGA